MKFILIFFLSLILNQTFASDLFTSDRSKKALSHPVEPLSDDLLDHFFLGRSFFTVPWVEAPAATTARDGLGPLFNANTCVSCHKNNGGGESSTLKQGSVNRSIVFKLVQPPSNTKNTLGFMPDPNYGEQLAINGIHGVPFEGHLSVTFDTKTFQYPDKTKTLLTQPIFKVSQLNYGDLAPTTTLNPRRALPLTGLGLIDKIPAQQILQRQDSQDQNQDGISGKANHVWSPSAQQYTLGRYGWKATIASLIDQTASALINDMGLTSPLAQQENCTMTQTACNAAYKSQSHDVPLLRLKAITTYISHLKTPKTSNAPVGKRLFEQVGCQACHQNNYRTEQGTIINPYSDFLLHDMGQELADNSQQFLALPSEWRTPPLWGLGLAKTLNAKAGFLHDGRASTVEHAILWHGGEASTARQNFINLSKKDRTILLSFLAKL